LTPDNSFLPMVTSLFLFFLILSCALVPEMDSYRADRIARGPEFAPYYGLKRRIAVLDFENHSEFGGEKLGSAVADQLISLLGRSDRYILVERSRIEKILQEQALGQTGTISEGTAPQVGKLLGVESLVLGKILEARQETGKGKIDNEKKKWSFALKATVGLVHISYKMVDATTGEILLADDVSTNEIKPGFGLKTKDFDLENMFDFDQTVLGTAVRKAVNKIAENIVENVAIIDWIGKVIQCKADTVIYFTPGRGAGVQLDQLFDIFKQIDLKNEQEISIADEFAINNQSNARVKVTGFIGDKVARAKVIHGGRIKKGDVVKLVKQATRDNIE